VYVCTPMFVQGGPHLLPSFLACIGSVVTVFCWLSCLVRDCVVSRETNTPPPAQTFCVNYFKSSPPPHDAPAGRPATGTAMRSLPRCLDPCGTLVMIPL